MFSITRNLITVIFLSVLLVACGGGGSDAPDSSKPSTLNSPPGGLYANDQLVEFSCEDSAGNCAQIFYISDVNGVITGPIEYTLENTPITISETTTLHFYSIDTAGNIEDERSAVYTIDKVGPNVVADPDNSGGQVFAREQTVHLNCTDVGGAECKSTLYSFDNTAPKSSWLSYDNEIIINSNSTLYFQATDTLGNEGPLAQVTYNVDLSLPHTEVNIRSGLYNTLPLDIKLTCHVGSAAGTVPVGIFYTLDGSTPTLNSSPYEVPIILHQAGTVVLKYFCYDDINKTETVKTQIYNIDAEVPVTIASRQTGYYNEDIMVSLNCDDTQPVGSGSGRVCTDIFYITDNVTQPDLFSTYQTPIPFNGEGIHTLRYFSQNEALHREQIKIQTYTIDKTLPNSTRSPTELYYTAPIDVTLECDSGGNPDIASPCFIFYSVDGSVPSIEYKHPVHISTQGTTEIKYISRDSAGNIEAIEHSASYILDMTKPDIQLSVAPGVYNSTQTLSLSCDANAAPETETDCTIRYSSDGSANLVDYTGPIRIDAEGETIIRYFAFDTAGNQLPAVVPVSYIIDSRPPVTSARVIGESFIRTYHNTDKQIELICKKGGIAVTSPNCEIYYSLDSSDPSILYSTPISINTEGSHSIKFRGIDAIGNQEFTIHTQVFVLDKQSPVTQVTPVGGLFGIAQTVNMECDAGATNLTEIAPCSIFYSIDGTTANVLYDAPISISNEGVTLLNYSSRDAASNVESNPIQEKYILDFTAPISSANLDSGVYSSAVTVSLKCDENVDKSSVAPCNILYTLDGGSEQTYTDPIIILDDGAHTLNFHSEDSVGNIEAANHQRDYIIDSVRPTSSADKVSGTYGSAFQVNLVCDQGSTTTTLSECSILYSINDITPSIPYTGPIDINTEGVNILRFKARDAAGNSELTLNMVDFTLNTQSVTISETTPSNDAIFTAINNNLFKATFTHSMNASTLSASNIMLAIDNNGVAGTQIAINNIVYDEATKTVSFNTSQNLQYSTDYQFSFSNNIQEISGVALQSTAPYFFRTLSDSARINIDTDASHRDAKLAFRSNNDGIAVWIADSGSNQELLYAFYSSNNNRWQSENSLAYDNISDVRVTTDGNGYLVSWLRDGIVWAKVFDNNNWSNEVQLSPDQHSSEAPVVASNGNEYIVVFNLFSIGTGTHNGIHFAVHAAGTWLPLGEVSNNETPPNTSNKYDVTSDGNNFMLVWAQQNGTAEINIKASEIRSSNSSWQAGTADTIDNLADDASAPNNSSPSIASNGNNYAVTWVQANPDVVGLDGANNVYVSIGNSGNWATPVLLDDRIYSVDSSLIVAIGNSYAVSWLQFDFDNQLSNVFINDYDFTTNNDWSGQRLASNATNNARSLKMASSTSEYAVLWQENPNGANEFIASIISNNNIDFDNKVGTTEEQSFNKAEIAGNRQDFFTVWPFQNNQNSIIEMHASRFTNNWTNDRNLVRSNHFGSVIFDIAGDNTFSNEPKQVINNAGTTLIIWTQSDNATNKLYAAFVNANNAVQTPFEITGNNVNYYDVSTRANEFMIVWTEARTVNSLRFDNTTELGPDIIDECANTFCVAPKYVNISSNGTTHMVVWQHRTDNGQPNQIKYNVYSGSTWLGTTDLSNAGIESQAPRLASNSTGYAAIWRSFPTVNTSDLVASIYDGGNWTAESSIIGTQPNTVSLGKRNNHKITSNNSGYAAVFELTDNTLARIHANVYSGASWKASSEIVDKPIVYTDANGVSSSTITASDSPDIASNGTTYAVTWKNKVGSITSNSNAIVYSIYSGSTWPMETILRPSPLIENEVTSPRISTDGLDYAISWLENNATEFDVYGAIVNSSGAQSLGRLEDKTGNAKSSSMGFNSSYSIIWGKTDNSNSGVTNLWRAFDF